MAEVLLREQQDGLLTLTLNRPEALGALNRELLGALADALAQAEQDSSVRAVLLQGAGRGFSVGQDLKEVEGQALSFKAQLAHYIPVILRLASIPKPVIAAVNGVAAGAGFSLALACDVRVASEAASFTTAFSRIGLIPDSGMSFTLTRLVGYAKAFELIALSAKLSAREALELGLVNQVVAADALSEAATTLANTLAQGPSKAYGLMKRALQRGLTATLSEVLELEAEYQEMAGKSEDYQEGLRAFLAKQKPAFRGQ